MKVKGRCCVHARRKGLLWMKQTNVLFHLSSLADAHFIGSSSFPSTPRPWYSGQIPGRVFGRAPPRLSLGRTQTAWSCPPTETQPRPGGASHRPLGRAFAEAQPRLTALPTGHPSAVRLPELANKPVSRVRQTNPSSNGKQQQTLN